MDEGKELFVGLTHQHLQAISAILYFYERHLWNFTAPSAKRTKQLTEIQLLLVKIQLLSIERIGSLTLEDIGYIDTAIRAFVIQAKEKIPQSESRDAVIDGCMEIREYLNRALLPSNGKCQEKGLYE